VEQENGKWYATVEITKDGEHGWSSYPIDSANSWGVIQPTILSYDHGRRFQALLRSNQNYILQSWSGDALHWSKLEKTPLRNPNSGIDAVTLKDGTQLLVYNPAGSGENWWDGRGHLNVAISIDGINWQDILILETHDKGEYSYPAVIQAPDGHVFISYTYDRKNIKLIELVKR
jgi:alpha-L-fucosidase